MTKKQELISALRKHFGISEDVCDDDMLLALTKGTLGRASVELKLAFAELGKSALPRFVQPEKEQG